MTKKPTSPSSSLQATAIRVADVHFYFAGAYGLAVLAFGAWKLLAPEALLQRWIMVWVMLVATAAIWFGAHLKTSGQSYYRNLIFVLILLDIALSSLTIYAERGMASRAVMLYAIPIAIAAVLRSTKALFATAALCAITYSATALRYSVVHPSEGYKIELYGVVAFYCAIFFLLAGALAILLDSQKKPG